MNHEPTRLAAEVELALKPLGFALKEPHRSSRLYDPVHISGHLGFVSGQTPRAEGVVAHIGRMESTDPDSRAKPAAELCVVNLLSVLEFYHGLNRLDSLGRLAVYVNSAPQFTRHRQVADFVSILLLDALGDRGRHTRTAIGVASLPDDALMEIDCTFTTKGTDQ